MGVAYANGDTFRQHPTHGVGPLEPEDGFFPSCIPAGGGGDEPPIDPGGAPSGGSGVPGDHSFREVANAAGGWPCDECPSGDDSNGPDGEDEEDPEDK